VTNDVDLAELERYLRIFQENPDSRVFAPLADLYRRLGRLDEAEKICREGIRRHPYYAGGRVALAHIQLDMAHFEEALEEINSVVTYYPDNLLARKILIRVLGALGDADGATRELDALRHMAPMIASDPDLEAAARGEAPSRRGFPEHPGERIEIPAPEQGIRLVLDPTLPEAVATAAVPNARRKETTPLLVQALKLKVRKKLVLEKYLDALGELGS
jgi:tetratricopeptide (TPR) repeat protein